MTTAREKQQAPVTQPGQWDTKPQKLWQRVLGLREMPIIIAIILLALFITWRNPTFLSVYNMQLLAKEVGVLGIMAIAAMVVIITRGIDLSTGSIVAMISVLAASGLARGLPVPAVILGCLAVCVFIGLVHSFFINVVGLAPFIITLGSLSIWRGATLVYTKGYPIKITDPAFLALGQGDIFGIPMQFVFLIAVAVVYTIVLKYTPLGRYIYALGFNATATRLAGISVPLVLSFVYVQATAMFGFAGLIYAARLGQGMPGIAIGLELPVIASAVIGGTSMSGGVGRPIGSIIGAILISLILNAMNMLAISSYWQEFVTGLVIVLAVAVDILNRRRAGVH